MSASRSRKEAIAAIAAAKNPEPIVDYVRHPVTEVFGANVFSDTVMRARLPKDTYKALKCTVMEGKPLDGTVADVVANTMKDWAIENGATHFTHWFQPLTGLTAEKHDSFIVPTLDGRAILEFSGKELIKGEPDASSFPSGGIRATFEARGYTAWDATSPAFLLDGVNGKTLCIPTAFLSYTGEALDKKVPLLRSMEAVSKQAVRMLRLFGDETVNRVVSTVGPEQEYFLVDRRFYLQRPDLINAGRTIFGAKPPKGQELEDHYFGSVRQRILAFMMEAEMEMYKLGIPVKTRHNEVAPAQFEIAPVYESCNLGTDHNMLIMETLKSTAERHGLACLMHEKPFAGVNGSGKHVNWSMATECQNLLEPGTTPHDNAQFLVFLAAACRAVYRHADLLRASVALAGNDHRLGANEAPPAIISIFLGEQLTEVVEQIIEGKCEPGTHGGCLEIGVSTLPTLPKDTTDRNRTSPFAFTGNKFEFRAVGSSQSIAGPLFIINTIVAESLDYLATQLEKEVAAGKALNEALAALLKATFKECQDIFFNGDNYTEEWLREATRRGLPNFTNAVDALQTLKSDATKKLFSKYGIFNAREAESRYTVMMESYIKAINIEALLSYQIARTVILPAAMNYQRLLATSLVEAKQALGVLELVPAGMGGSASGSTAFGPQEELLSEVATTISGLKVAIDELGCIHAEAEEAEESILTHARHFRDKVVPAMARVRTAVDELELVVDDDLWPLPKYREMLFVY
ncbi:MAG: glutamine synthetase III family protein [Armatimonadota bacterium]